MRIYDISVIMRLVVRESLGWRSETIGRKYEQSVARMHGKVTNEILGTTGVVWWRIVK